MLYINGFYSTSSSNWWKVFFFQISDFFFQFRCNFFKEYWRCVMQARLERHLLNSRRSSFYVIYSLCDCDICYVIYSYRQDIKSERKWAKQHTAQIISRSNWFSDSHNNGHVPQNCGTTAIYSTYILQMLW